MPHRLDRGEQPLRSVPQAGQARRGLIAKISLDGFIEQPRAQGRAHRWLNNWRDSLTAGQQASDAAFRGPKPAAPVGSCRYRVAL